MKEPRYLTQQEQVKQKRREMARVRERNCTACSGTGECWHCKGSGIGNMDNNYDNCTACGGSGECATCDGSGKG